MPRTKYQLTNEQRELLSKLGAAEKRAAKGVKQRDELAYEAVANGIPYREIGAALGKTSQTVHRKYHDTGGWVTRRLQAAVADMVDDDEEAPVLPASAGLS